MREMLYISRSKLDQFVEERRSLLEVFRGEVELSLLEVIKLKFASPESRPEKQSSMQLMKKVRRVVKRLDRSGDPPLWFESSDVEPGCWIQYNASLNFIVTQKGLFLMWMNPVSNISNQTILIIHGSVRNVLNSSIRRVDGTELEEEEEEATSSVGFMEHIRELLDLSEEEFKEIVERNRESRSRSGVFARLLDDLWSSPVWWGDFGKVTGYARVTALENRVEPSPKEYVRVVAASPLYVERT